MFSTLVIALNVFHVMMVLGCKIVEIEIVNLRDEGYKIVTSLNDLLYYDVGSLFFRFSFLS